MRRTGLLLVAGLAVLCVVAVRGAGRFLVIADPLPPHAGAIVMLAGSPSDRSLEAARLYRAGLAPIVVLTRPQLPRGAPALRGQGVFLPEEHELETRALGALGVPADASASCSVAPPAPRRRRARSRAGSAVTGSVAWSSSRRPRIRAAPA
jgi:uncharacterized SAM-binding protein YcdF (DUF218 family)